MQTQNQSKTFSMKRQVGAIRLELISVSGLKRKQEYFYSPLDRMLVHRRVIPSIKLSPALNRPFPSSLVPLFQNESTCETFHMKMSSACSFIFMQIKVIFIRMVSHLDSHKGTRKWPIRRYPFMVYLAVRKRHCESKMSCPKTQRNVSGQGSNADRSIGIE